MNPADRAHLVRLERKAFRAAKPPRMAAIDNAGVSTRPWGARRMAGVGVNFGRGPGPSRAAVQNWERATGVRPARTRKVRRILGVRL